MGTGANTFTATELVELDSLFVDSTGEQQLVAAFRRQFPGRSLTRCEMNDMSSEQPYRSLAALNVYLVDGRDHCWRITDDPAAATGIVLAMHAGHS